MQSTGCNYHQSFLAIELAPDITVLLLEQNILANHEFTFSHGDCTAFLFLRNAAGRETDPTVTNSFWVETCLLQTAPWVWGHGRRMSVGLPGACSDPTATSTPGSGHRGKRCPCCSIFSVVPGLVLAKANECSPRSCHGTSLSSSAGQLDYEVPVLKGERVYPGGQVLPVGFRAREHSQCGCYSSALP